MRNSKFDFRSLKTLVSIGQVLSAYGLDRQLKRKNHQLSGPCPLHRGDNPTAFRVRLDRGVWHCFTACGGGDTVELIRRIENCSYAEAARHLYRLASELNPASELNLVNGPKPLLQLPPSLPPSLPPAAPAAYPAPQNGAFFPFKRTIPLNPKVSFLQDRKKISVQTATHHEAGTCECSTFLRNTVAVHLHDLSGNPLGYCGRRLDHKAIVSWGKWLFPKNFPKKDVLYNAHRALPFRHKGIIVVECPWAVMRFAQSGICNAVALLGTSLSPLQAAWLTHAPKILLMLDGDQTGKKAASAIANILQPKTRLSIHELHNGMEPEDLADNQLNLIATNFSLSF
jgi:DNA primase